MDRDRDPTAEARARMVETQLHARGIRDSQVLAVMGRIHRDEFVPPDVRAVAYADGAQPIGAGQTISQPLVVARMTELLHVSSGDHVLDVGTGSGYQAAVLAELGCVVTSIERDADLAAAAAARLAALGYGPDRVTVRCGDGSLGVPGERWDGIVVAAASPSVPDSLRAQLAVGRRLVIPVGSRGRQELVVVERTGPDEWREMPDGPVVFVPLIGAEGWTA